MKFESAAQDILGIHPLVAALSNLGKDERHLAERMRRVIDGEIKQRYELVSPRWARATATTRRDRGSPDSGPTAGALSCSSSLTSISELFANHEKWINLMIHIGQEGRGANVFFMLGGQRLDLSSLQKAKSNIAFRITLRAESGDDSREVIGSDAALPPAVERERFAGREVGRATWNRSLLYLSLRSWCPRPRKWRPPST